jgi:hypothetical protein
MIATSEVTAIRHSLTLTAVASPRAGQSQQQPCNGVLDLLDRTQAGTVWRQIEQLGARPP